MDHQEYTEFHEYMHEPDTENWVSDTPPRVNWHGAFSLALVAILVSTAAWAFCHWIVPVVLRWFR